MLVLRRNAGERVIVRGPGLVAPITIVVLGTSGGQVRLGIDAPRTMAVVREELDEKYASLRFDAEAKEAANREQSSK